MLTVVPHPGCRYSNAAWIYKKPVILRLLPPTIPTRDSGKTLSISKPQSSADIPSLL